MKYLNIKPDGIYADGTLGGGGNAAGICERLGKEGTLIGIDRDESHFPPDGRVADGQTL